MRESNRIIGDCPPDSRVYGKLHRRSACRPLRIPAPIEQDLGMPRQDSGEDLPGSDRLDRVSGLRPHRPAKSSAVARSKAFRFPRLSIHLMQTLAVCAVLLLLTPALPAQFQAVRIQVIDRGQADGILIRTPNSKWIVIDAGTNKQQADAMKNEWGVDEVALAIVSHRHFDHQGGMDEVLSGFTVRKFLGVTEDCDPTKPNDSDDMVRNVLTSKGIPVENLGVGAIEIDGVTVRVLPLPPRSKCPSEENNNSVVVRLEFGKFSMLFMGDAEEKELDFLAGNHPELLSAEVLKAGHHGSQNAFTGEFLKAVSPKQVVISAGVNKRFAHPRPEAVAAYLKVTGNKLFCTNRQGTIRVYGFRDGRTRVNVQRESDKSCVFDGT